MKKKLTLKKETLRQLATQELSQVVGGTAGTSVNQLGAGVLDAGTSVNGLV